MKRSKHGNIPLQIHFAKSPEAYQIECLVRPSLRTNSDSMHHSLRTYAEPLHPSIWHSQFSIPQPVPLSSSDQSASRRSYTRNAYRNPTLVDHRLDIRKRTLLIRIQIGGIDVRFVVKELSSNFVDIIQRYHHINTISRFTRRVRPTKTHTKETLSITGFVLRIQILLRRSKGPSRDAMHQPKSSIIIHSNISFGMAVGTVSRSRRWFIIIHQPPHISWITMVDLV